MGMCKNGWNLTYWKKNKNHEQMLLTLHGRYALVPTCAVTFVIP